MKSLIFAGAVALVAFVWLGSSVFAWQSRIEGRPVSFEAGSTGGYYIWHDDGGLHLRTTDPENVDSHFTGRITTNGRLYDISLVKPEGDDSVTDDGAGTLTFDLHTGSGIDGFDFKIDGGDGMRLDLHRDGHAISVDHIFLGAYSVHPDHNPFRVER